MRKIILMLVLISPNTAFSTPIIFDLRAPEIEDIDEVNSFSLVMGGLTATLTAQPPTFTTRDLELNRTSSSFGINVAGTTCGSKEKSAQIDDGCIGESIEIFFDQDVLLNNLAVSIFGSSDEARVVINGSSSIDILSTGIHSLGGTFLEAGATFSVVFVAGTGFSFDNFAVTPVP